MQTIVNRATRILISGALSLAAITSFGATDTGNLTVTATVANQCSVGDATLALGAITLVGADGTMASNITGSGATANIPWACTNGTAATLSFGDGTNVGGGSIRRMKATVDSESQYLEYSLRATSSAGAVIGLSDAGTSVTGDGTSKTFTVWAGVANSAANKVAKPSTGYTDTVVATITFTP